MSEDVPVEREVHAAACLIVQPRAPTAAARSACAVLQREVCGQQVAAAALAEDEVLLHLSQVLWDLCRGGRDEFYLPD